MVWGAFLGVQRPSIFKVISCLQDSSRVAVGQGGKLGGWNNLLIQSTTTQRLFY